MNPPLSLEACAARDAADPLAGFRSRFTLPAGVIYLDGNSLGAMPAALPARLDSVAQRQWGQDLIRSWNQHGWVDLADRVAEKIARIIGAQPGETMVGDSTSVNLFKVLSAALRLRPGRRRIVSERDNFPTDLYMAQGLIALLGNHHELVLVEPGEWAPYLDDDLAVLMLTQVSYRSGRMHDIRAVTAQAQAAGALTVWDLAHSAGAVPLALASDGADFAVGCGYKYLNGGPGAPAFLYVAQRHQAQFQPALSGWFGHAAPFEFETGYRPAEGIGRTRVGTPPILSLSALEVGVDLMLEAPMPLLREKSLALTELFITLLRLRLGSEAFILVTPEAPEQRGSQVSLAHPQAWPIMQALIARGVIGDFRAPDILRFGFTPLYLSHTDVWHAVDILSQIMASGEWQQERFQARAAVT